MIEHLRTAEQIAAWTQQLVRSPSPQTELMEAEPAVLNYLSGCVAPMLGEAGFVPRRSPMGDLIVEIGPEDGKDCVLLVGYAMTHPASSMRDPYAGERLDTRSGPAVRGRGAAEQKGALAAAIASFEAASKSELSGKVVLAVSTAGETGRHDSIKSILSALPRRPTLGVIAIGTGNRIALGNKGRIDFDVVISGKAAHSSTPWLGVDAIEGAREVLNLLSGLNLGDGRHPVLGGPSPTATHIETAPKATHTIQNRAVITYDRRLLPGDSPEPALAHIRSVLADVDPKWQVELRPGPYMYPAEIRPDGKLVSRVAEGLAAWGRPTPVLFWSHSALDAGYLIAEGCEAAMWGPGEMELFHTDDELVPVADLRSCAEGYLALIAAAVGNAGSKGNS